MHFVFVCLGCGYPKFAFMIDTCRIIEMARSKIGSANFGDEVSVKGQSIKPAEGGGELEDDRSDECNRERCNVWLRLYVAS